MSADVRAMILAAGLGTRLRPLTETLPKPLVTVAGRPLIDHALETVARAGITEVVINLFHLAEMVADYVGDGSRWGLRVRFSREDPIQDTGGGIRDARELLGEATFVTLNSDTIVDVDLARCVDWHRERGALATMVLRRDPDAAAYGIIETEPDGRIGAFLGRARPGGRTPRESFLYTGVQVLDPRIFDYLDAEGPFSITRYAYPRMLDADEPLFGWEHRGRWITVGTPAERARAEAQLTQRPVGDA